MKYRLLLISILSFAAWVQPIHAASALLSEPKLEEIPQVIYEPPSNNPKPLLHTKTRSYQTETAYSGRDTRHYSPEEVQDLIRRYAGEYNSSASLPLRIAKCESGFNQFAANKTSSARGVYQWLSSSWRNQPASHGGTVSVFDAEANVSAAVWLIAHGKTSPWNASRSCWSNN